MGQREDGTKLRMICIPVAWVGGYSNQRACFMANCEIPFSFSGRLLKSGKNPFELSKHGKFNPFSMQY